MQSLTKITDSRAIYFFIAILCISQLDTIFGGLRYIKYAIPVICMLVIFNVSNISKRIKREPRTYILIMYVLFALYSLFISYFFYELSIYGFNDVYFIVAYALPLLLFNVSQVNVYLVFQCFTAFFIISLLGQSAGQFSLLNSEALFESSASFVFGGFTIFFLLDKKYKYFLVSVLFLFLSLKRIALLAVLICLLIYFLPFIIRKLILSRFSFVILSFSWVLIVLALVSGVLNVFIEELLGVDVNFLTMGRLTLYTGVVNEMINNPFNLIFGNGIGSSYELALIEMADDSHANLHSDTLKIFYESGFFVFILLFISFGTLKKQSAKLMALYICIIYLTDNVLIYQSQMFFLLLLVFYSEYKVSN